MPTPEKHALLSASASERWLNCTRAPRLEETLPESTSEYAEEGRLAHSIAELKARKHFTKMTNRTYNAELKKLQADPLYQTEMDGYTDAYVEHLSEIAMSYKAMPHVALETRVDYSDYAPEGFGTSDCIMIGGDTISVIDYKYGKGVPVSAENNTQMKLYALGALKLYAPIFGDAIQNARVSVIQPRLDNFSSWGLTRTELEDWGRSAVAPRAKLAFAGEGEFAAGEWCRFCRARRTCRARAETNITLADFKQALPPQLSDAEVGGVLTLGRQLKAWLSDLEDYALSACLEGREIPGWKAVEGRSNRQFDNTDQAFETIISAGYQKELLYDYVPKTLTAVEKLLGAKAFVEIVGGHVIKPPGKPTLAPEEDKRRQYNPAAAAFGAPSIQQ